MSDRKDTFWGAVLGTVTTIAAVPIALGKAAYDKLEGNDTFADSANRVLDKGFEMGKEFGDDNAKSINGGIAGALAWAATAAALAQGKPPPNR